MKVRATTHAATSGTILLEAARFRTAENEWLWEPVDTGETFCGMRVMIDPWMPSNTVEIHQRGRVIGRIINIARVPAEVPVNENGPVKEP